MKSTVSLPIDTIIEIVCESTDRYKHFRYIWQIRYFKTL